MRFTLSTRRVIRVLSSNMVKAKIILEGALTDLVYNRARNHARFNVYYFAILCTPVGIIIARKDCKIQ